ncbi:porin, partial [Pseudomonas aeruginosa]
ELLEKGYDFKLEYVGEAAANLDGGYDDDKTGRYTDQFALGVHMDLEKILGWKATEFQFTVTERNGKNLSNDRIGDPRAGHISSVQEVWGRGQTWRLTQLWLKQQYFDGALDVKFGRFGEGEDFNSFPCDFQNLAFCGSQVGNWAGSIWYNWPVSQWALRVKYNFAPDWYVQVGAYEQNPSNLETGNGFKMSGSGTKGALLPVELIWQPKVGAEQLPGEYRLGYYYSTAKADDVYDDVDGQPQGLTGNDFKSRGSKHGWWVVAQQQVTSHNGDASRGLSLFANLTVHDKATNVVDNYQQLGVVYKGSTAKADDVYDDVDGQPQGLTGNDFKSRGSKHGWWVVAQQQVTSHNGDASRGLSLFANLTVHDKATNVVDNYQQLGVVYKGPFDARPKDDIGLGIARIHVNDDVKKRQRLVNQVNGIDDYDNPLYQPLQDTEYNAELYYGVHVTDWLTVRPNLQYIKQPGGVDEVDNALVAGIKIQTVF